jgi:hypothetical protein
MDSGVFLSNINEEKLKPVKGELVLDAQEWITLIVDFNEAQ